MCVCVYVCVCVCVRVCVCVCVRVGVLCVGEGFIVGVLYCFTVLFRGGPEVCIDCAKAVHSLSKQCCLLETSTHKGSVLQGLCQFTKVSGWGLCIVLTGDEVILSFNC